MSHFSVLVAARDESDLEAKMLPYHEHECTGRNEYCQWVDDIHDEHLVQYNSEGVECVLRGGKVLGSKYSRNPIVESMWKRDGIGISSKDQFILLEGYDLADVPFKELYPTFDEFMKDWCGYTEKNPATGKFERWTNPNKKWDWYKVGGRWSEKLITKSGEKVNEALVASIDFEAMYQAEHKRLTDQHNAFHAYYNECSPGVTEVHKSKYEEWVKRNPKVAEVLTLDQYTRTSYALDKMEWFMWSLSEAERLLKSSLEKYSEPEGLTYAFIDAKGHWNQKGEMGWWGIDDPDKATECYGGEWWGFVQNLPKNIMVYIVDCHI